MLEINLPEVVAEVADRCEAYERALVANDVAALHDFFWDSPHAIRFGAGEAQYGAGEIAAFRTRRAVDFTGRRVLRLEILALGRDVAVSMQEAESAVGGAPRQVRQTQVWARIPEVGWRVTSAHVSNPVEPPTGAIARLVDANAAAIGLPLAAEHRAGTIRHFETAAAIAAPLLAFRLPEGVEFAPVFTP